jgi:hypothetical protein
MAKFVEVLQAASADDDLLRRAARLITGLAAEIDLLRHIHNEAMEPDLVE